MARASHHPDDIRADLDALGVRQTDLEETSDRLAADLETTIRRARAAGIPSTEIAQRTRMSRAWLYRRYRDALTGS